MVQWLGIFGRNKLDPHSGIDGADLWSRVASLHAFASEDQEGFLSALRAVVEGDRGGFATLGAAHLVWELFGGRALDIPAALPLIDAGIDFKLARGLPTAALTGYEMKRLQQIRAAAQRSV